MIEQRRIKSRRGLRPLAFSCRSCAVQHPKASNYPCQAIADQQGGRSNDASSVNQAISFRRDPEPEDTTWTTIDFLLTILSRGNPSATPISISGGGAWPLFVKPRGFAAPQKKNYPLTTFTLSPSCPRERSFHFSQVFIFLRKYSNVTCVYVCTCASVKARNVKKHRLIVFVWVQEFLLLFSSC